MIDPSQISKIGFGTWGIGGYAEPDPDNDDQKDVAGIVHWLHKGANYAEIPQFYAMGRSAELVARAIEQSDVSRDNLFLAMMVHHHRDPSPTAIDEHFRAFCSQFNTDYVDTVQVSMGGVMTWGYDEVVARLHALLESDRARFVSITNANSDLLTQFKNEFGDRLFGHEVHLNFEIRANQDEGVIDLADTFGVRNIIAQPLRRNRTAGHNWLLLTDLANTYHATPNQIVLAWQIARGMLPIPKSSTVVHIDEIWDAQHISLDSIDIDAIDSWRPPHYTPPEVDWNRTQNPENGIAVDQLSNVFDDDYASQTRT